VLDPLLPELPLLPDEPDDPDDPLPSLVVPRELVVVPLVDPPLVGRVYPRPFTTRPCGVSSPRTTITGPDVT